MYLGSNKVLKAFTVQVKDELLSLKLNVKPQICNLLHNITKYIPSASLLRLYQLYGLMFIFSN